MTIATAYAATHPSFPQLTEPDHAESAWEILTCVEALQDYISHKSAARSIDSVKIEIEDIEIILGSGCERAELAAKLAGFVKFEQSSIWYIGDFEDSVHVRIPRGLLAKFVSKYADVVY